ncbi:uncharacterized protein EURHEDRAFT_32580 [Aspergillus ruber CBS 135680]|uniref:Uncharacterized protein n=1 Tax=Aspergillus ruber (strain CBS 135680) TaxID=1388766 RepID=A0A017SSC5_ASPRC|nr:uncharacterized protein EURHEDRAFT_32580 [Aspergillus ruber CBS 135680]EYE99878.1 hypothetical protein EURHEDRAFT_32580 [Aspergillus ruber CBS 135680]
MMRPDHGGWRQLSCSWIFIPLLISTEQLIAAYPPLPGTIRPRACLPLLYLPGIPCTLVIAIVFCYSKRGIVEYKYLLSPVLRFPYGVNNAPLAPPNKNKLKSESSPSPRKRSIFQSQPPSSIIANATKKDNQIYSNRLRSKRVYCTSNGLPAYIHFLPRQQGNEQRVKDSGPQNNKPPRGSI